MNTHLWFVERAMEMLPTPRTEHFAAKQLGTMAGWQVAPRAHLQRASSVGRRDLEAGREAVLFVCRLKGVPTTGSGLSEDPSLAARCEVIACNDVSDHVLMRSCDEAVGGADRMASWRQALRVSGFPDPVAWGEALRTAVYKRTGCTCSVGLGPTQLVAKLATKALWEPR